MSRTKEKSTGVIYILTNPSFPEYVKIGYADDLKRNTYAVAKRVAA